MNKRSAQRGYAFTLSVLGHAAIVVMLTFSLPLSSPRRAAAPNVVPIDTVMLDQTAVTDALARIEEAEQEAIRQQQQAERDAAEREKQLQAQREAEQRAADEAKRREAAAAAAQAEADRKAAAEADRIRRQQEADAKAEADRLEQQRLADAKRAEDERQKEEAAERERQRQEDERREALAAQRRREEAERIRREAIAADIAQAAADEAAATAAEEAGLKDQWVLEIQNRIRQKWRQPPTAKAGIECVVAVTQIRSGEVINATVERCNGDDAVKKSIERAVYDASPLPQPPVPQLFERDLNIIFRPDE